MSLIAGAILFCTSLLFTTVVFPEYFRELQAAHTEILRAEGKPLPEIEAAVKAAAEGQTPIIQAVSGFVGTVVTGFAASLVIAALFRRRAP